jgi:hypothetical protein
VSRDRDAEFIRRLYGRYDPARGITADGQARDAAVAHLAELDSQPYVAEVRSPVARAGLPGARMVGPTRRRLLIAGTAVAAAGAAGGLAAAWSGGGQAARGQAAAGPVATPKLLSLDKGNPTMSAAQVLLKAAASAERQPDTTGTGRYQYVETSGWGLVAEVSNRGTSVAVVPTLRQQWIAADGSGRLIQRPQAPQFPNPADRKKWAGGYLLGSDHAFGPGGLGPIWQPGSLSTEPSVLRRQLEKGYSGGSAPLSSVSELYDEQPVSPAVRAAILRMLAAVPGLRYDGTGTDRVGRSGIGISLETSRFRYVLIFDPVTGQLLDSELVVLTKSQLDLPVPFVTGYTVYLASGRTNQTTVPPAG